MTIPVVTLQPLTLADLQLFVGGYVERVWAGEPFKSNALYVNEEGKLRGLPQNPIYPHLVGDVIEGKEVLGAGGEKDYVFVGLDYEPDGAEA